MGTTIFLSIGLLGAIMLGMAVGVVFSNKPLKGSCGGIGAGGGDCECSPIDRERCATEAPG